MNTFEKLVFTFLIAFGMLAMAKDVSAASRYSGIAWVEASASSGSLSGYSKGCSVLAVYASTDTDLPQNWFQLIATNPVTAISGHSQFSAADHRSPALFFSSTATAINNWNMPAYKVLDYGVDGISFATAPYIYKSGATSGQARRVWLLIVP